MVIKCYWNWVLCLVWWKVTTCTITLFIKILVCKEYFLKSFSACTIISGLTLLECLHKCSHEFHLLPLQCLSWWPNQHPNTNWLVFAQTLIQIVLFSWPPLLSQTQFPLHCHHLDHHQFAQLSNIPIKIDSLASWLKMWEAQNAWVDENFYHPNLRLKNQENLKNEAMCIREVTIILVCRLSSSMVSNCILANTLSCQNMHLGMQRLISDVNPY